MNHTVVGHCPKCGSPVYAPSVWGAVIPPPSTPSCNCNPQTAYTVTTTTGTFTFPKEQKP